MDWLLAPIDPTRAHEVGFAISWHARFMVLAWGILAPLGVVIARYFKVMPGQDWPRELDNQVWWRSHWIGMSVAAGLSIGGLALVMPAGWPSMSLHMWCGYAVFAGMVSQVLLGLFRGSKGGPTVDGSPRGHHYDMTKHRRIFEALHKTIGYGTLVLAAVTILLGLWQANGPVWMWGILVLWWACLIIACVHLQKRGMAIDTYQAIWGDDPDHPGNQMPSSGWGVRRYDGAKGDADVRRN